MQQANVGAPIRRTEDQRLLTGTGTFVDDIKPQGLLHAAILRSPHAHARITSIDIAGALEIPGVVAVYTFEDIASNAKPIPMRMHRLPGLERFLQYPLARDKVRYVGEPIAIAIAESRYLAEDALDAIQVTYEPLQAVVDTREAMRDEVIIHEGCRHKPGRQSGRIHRGRGGGLSQRRVHAQGGAQDPSSHGQPPGDPWHSGLL